MESTYRNLLCPAKVNLILRVGAPESNGFHPLETLMAKVNWGDRISLKISRASLPSIWVESGDLNIPMEKNLVYRAAALFCEAYGQSLKIEIELQKFVPMGAGLGGGSSDAAMVFRVLWNFVFKKRSYDQKLFKLAARLGSDIPFFLGNGSAWCTGYGEILEPVQVPNFHLVLVFPPVGVPTPWAYGELDRSRKGVDLSKRLNGKPRWLERSSYGVPDLENDFESLVYAKFPKIKAAHGALALEGALAARMSGSGSTVFGIFSDLAAAGRASRALRSKGWNTEACSTFG